MSSDRHLLPQRRGIPALRSPRADSPELLAAEIHVKATQQDTNFQLESKTKQLAALAELAKTNRFDHQQRLSALQSDLAEREARALQSLKTKLLQCYGAHLFHTRSERVWDYMQTWSKWTKWEHKVLGMAGDKYFPIPVNIETVNVLFDENIQNPKQMDAWLAKEQVSYERDPQNSEEMALSRVGQRLYDIIFKPYTIKQWDKQPSQLGPEVTARIPIRNDFDDRYFSDPYQALPSDGYTAIFERMFDNSLITVRLNTDYFDVRDKIRCGKTYFTGPVDAYYAHLGWDKLEYRSIDFERQVIRNTEFFQPAAVVNHPTPEVDYTRIVEYKHFLNQASPDTVIFYERSMDIGDPYYPVPNHRNKALYEKYKTMADKEYNVKFVGRLANYKYFNMDESILNALQLFDKETSRPFWKKGFPWADSKRI